LFVLTFPTLAGWDYDGVSDEFGGL